jgi:D-sedoheptulose 7-phosphate isomerase
MPGSSREHAARYVGEVCELLNNLDLDAVARFIEVLDEARRRGATVFFVGNGGSAATASHWANDLGVGTRVDGVVGFRAVSLTDNVVILTALANDHGYDEVFVRQLVDLFRPGDVLVAISVSGNSPNVVRAVEWANARGGATVGLIGFDGGKLRTACQLVIHVPGAKGNYGPPEDVHLVLDHLVTGHLRERLLAERRGTASRSAR